MKNAMQLQCKVTVGRKLVPHATLTSLNSWDLYQVRYFLFSCSQHICIPQRDGEGLTAGHVVTGVICGCIKLSVTADDKSHMLKYACIRIYTNACIASNFSYGYFSLHVIHVRLFEPSILLACKRKKNAFMRTWEELAVLILRYGPLLKIAS